VRDDHLPAKSSASRLSGRCYIGGARYTIYGSSDPIVMKPVTTTGFI